MRYFLHFPDLYGRIKNKKELIFMKKILSILCIFCLLFSAAACNADQKQNKNHSESSSDIIRYDPEKNAYTFKATVLQTGERSILVKTDDPQMLRSSDQYWVSLPENISGKDFRKGDVLQINFDGIIMETYPAQINASEISHINP